MDLLYNTDKEALKKETSGMKINNIIIIILVISTAMLFVQNKQLKDDITLLESSVSNEILRVEDEISSIYANVDDQMKKHTSLFSEISHSFGELDAEKKAVLADIKLVPKTLTDNMKISIKTNEGTVPAVRDGNIFTAKVHIGVFAGEEKNLLAEVISSGETKTEYLEVINTKNLWRYYVPGMYAGAVEEVNKTGYRDGKLNLKLILDIGQTLPEYNKDAKFMKFTLRTVINGAEVKSEDITQRLDPDGMIFEQSCEMAEQDVLELFVRAEDSLGFIHEAKAYHWQKSDSGAVAEVRYDGEYIYDENGNLLFGKES